MILTDTLNKLIDGLDRLWKREDETVIGQNRNSRTFKVRIDDVLDALRKGKDEHLQIVEEAQQAFREKATKRLEEMLASARAGERIDLSVGLLVPTNHTDMYDNAIETLELTKKAGETTIELTSDEIERFVRGRWEWLDQFITTNAMYSGKAAGMMKASGKAQADF